MSEELYLGYAEYIPRPQTRIKCIAKAIDGAWKKQDLINEFPPFGLVFAVSISDINLGQPLAITAKQNTREVSIDQDQKIVDKKIFPLKLVLDYRGKDLDDIRYSLSERGVIRTAPFSSELIIALNDIHCAVVDVLKHPVTGKYVTNSGTIKKYHFNKSIFYGDKIEDQFLEIPGVTVGDFIEEIVWPLDQDILDNLFRQLRQYDNTAPTKKERERIIYLLNRAIAVSDENTDWKSHKKWLERYSQRALDSLVLSESVTQMALQLKPIREEIEKIKISISSELHTELEPLVRAEIEEKIAILFEQEQKLKEKVEIDFSAVRRLESTKTDIETTVLRLKEQLSHEVNKLNMTLGSSEKLDEDELSELVTRLQEALGNSKDLLSPVNTSIPPWGRGSATRTTELIKHAELAGRIEKESRKIGFCTETIKFFDVAMRSGLFTVVSDTDAEILIPTYARVTTGEVYFRMPLGPNLINLEDLWVEPVRGGNTSFSRAWLAAQNDPDRYHIIWLDGIQRTAMDLWLPSLLGVLFDINKPKNLMVVASISNGSIDNIHSWKELTNYSIPIAPAFKSLRPQNLIKNMNAVLENGSFLLASELLNLAESDFSNIFDDKEQKNPLSFKIEAGLYRAVSLSKHSTEVASDKIKLMNSIRKQGCDWLDDILR